MKIQIKNRKNKLNKYINAYYTYIFQKRLSLEMRTKIDRLRNTTYFTSIQKK